MHLHFRSLGLTSVFLGGALLGIAATTIGAGMLGSDLFSDVKRGSNEDAAIGELVNAGIMQGLDNKKFGPNEPVKRGELALILQRLRNEGAPPLPTPPPPPPPSGRSSSSRSVSSRSRSPSLSSSSLSSASIEPVRTSPNGVFRFAMPAFGIDESAGGVNVIVLRTGGKEGSVTVEYSVEGGSAKPNTDYKPLSGTLSFANREVTKTIHIDLIDNTTADSDKTVNIVLKNPTGGSALSTPATTTMTIYDNEKSGAAPSASSSSAASVNLSAAGGVFSFSAIHYAVMEHAPAVTIQVVRTGNTSQAATINYLTNDGTAKGGTDYNVVSGTLSFAVGEAGKTFTVAPKDNSAIDGNRTITLLLNTPTGGSAIGTPASAVLTIIDNETNPVSGTGSVKFSSSTYRVTEGEGLATITVMRIAGLSAFTVNYATSNGTAIESDYTVTSGTLSFAANETSKTFSVPITKDNRVEDEETVNLTLSNTTGGVALIDPSTATLKIFD